MSEEELAALTHFIDRTRELELDLAAEKNNAAVRKERIAELEAELAQCASITPFVVRNEELERQLAEEKVKHAKTYDAYDWHFTAMVYNYNQWQKCKAALELIADARCAWQLSQEIARKALEY